MTAPDTLCPSTVEAAADRGLLAFRDGAYVATCPACPATFTAAYETTAFDAMQGHYEARTWAVSAVGVDDPHEATPCAACGDLDDVETTRTDKRGQAPLCAACRDLIADGANPVELLGED